MKYENNLAAYRRGCQMYGIVMAGGLIALSVALYFGLLKEDPDGLAVVAIGVLSAVTFYCWHMSERYRLLNIPEMSADAWSGSKLAGQWGLECGVSFGGVYAIVMLVGTCMKGQLEETLLITVVGSLMAGLIVGVVARLIAGFFVPAEYLPWETLAGYEAYKERMRLRN